MTPTVTITPAALEAMQAHAADAMRDGNETGGYLFGTINGEHRTILHATGPGPKALRTPACFEVDYEHVGRELIRRRQEPGGPGPDLKVVGADHLHPLAGLSGGDRATLKRVCETAPGFLAVVMCGFRNPRLRIFTVVDGEIVELPWRVAEPAPAMDVSRMSGLLGTTALSDAKVLILGAGSGASLSSVLLAQAGVGTIWSADNEKLEGHNIVRHIGRHDQIGEFKANVVCSEARRINPRISARPILKRISAATADEFRAVIRQADIVVAATGSAAANGIANHLCRELSKPLVLGAAFAKASGGFVLQCLPDAPESPCLNCIFEYAREAFDDSNEQLEHLARDYGMSPDELAAQQGIATDIAFISALLARVTVSTLLRGRQHDLPPLPGNLVLWSQRELSARWIRAARRADCSVCNREGWERSQKTGTATIQLRPKLKENGHAPHQGNAPRQAQEAPGPASQRLLGKKPADATGAGANGKAGAKPAAPRRPSGRSHR